MSKDPKFDGGFHGGVEGVGPNGEAVKLGEGKPADEAAPRASVNHELGPAPAPKPAVLAELHVVLFADGHFSLNGPLDNPFHFHGLLGLAAEGLREARARAAAEAKRIDVSAATRGPGFLKKLLAGKREAQGILKKGS